MINKTTPETRQEFETLLDTYNVFVERTLIVLFGRQTADEQVAENTCHNNARGFTGIDAHFLSSLAKRVINLREQGVAAGRCLTPGMLAACRKRNARETHMLGKYWKQIKEEMEAKKVATVAA